MRINLNVYICPRKSCIGSSYSYSYASPLTFKFCEKRKKREKEDRQIQVWKTGMGTLR